MLYILESQATDKGEKKAPNTDLWLNPGILEEKQGPISCVVNGCLMAGPLIHPDVLVIDLMNPCWDSCGQSLRLLNHCWS